MTDRDRIDPARLDDLLDGRAAPRDAEEEAVVRMAADLRQAGSRVEPSAALEARVEALTRDAAPARQAAPARRWALVLAPVAAAVAAVAVVLSLNSGGGGPAPQAPAGAAAEGVAPSPAAPQADRATRTDAADVPAPAAGTPPPLIVPGRSMAGVRIGEPAPRAAPPTGVEVTEGADGRVAALTTTDDTLRTAGGAGVGSTPDAVRAAVPGATCDAASCTAPGITFALDGGTVARVRVAAP